MDGRPPVCHRLHFRTLVLFFLHVVPLSNRIHVYHNQVYTGNCYLNAKATQPLLVASTRFLA